MKPVSQTILIVLTAIFVMAFGNFAFLDNFLDAYPLDWKNAIYLVSVMILFATVAIIFLSLLCYRHTIKPVLVTVLLLSALAACFMDSYNIVVDKSMIDNILSTNLAESLDLFNFRLVLYVLLLGVVPGFFIYRARIIQVPLRQSVLARLKLIGLSFLTIAVMLFAFGDFYSSFFREHKPLRYYANPAYYMYSLASYTSRSLASSHREFRQLALDAHIMGRDNDGDRELIILVVGETARADHFSLNGYVRETNPLLKKEKVISFHNIWSCGTSTAISVPCMFSALPQAEFDESRAASMDNLLDIAQRAGINVLWLDNNSTSKGVAARVPYESYRTPEVNPVCDVECRDEGMLVRLQDYIDSHPDGDILIVLHQMGNHGPAYYKRYPKQFERFTPVCHTNELENCTDEEITNAYDNGILYTDYFLSRVIALLKRNSPNFEAGMIYASDHGESLGEYGLYLHGLPYFMAPDAQKHVPLIMWFSDSFDQDEVNVRTLQASVGHHYSHDNLFHTILGLFEMETQIYDPSLDIIGHRHRHLATRQ